MILALNALAPRDLSLVLADLQLRISRESLWQDQVMTVAAHEGFTGVIRCSPAHGMVTTLVRALINHHVPLRMGTRVTADYWLWPENSGVNPATVDQWHAQIYLTAPVTGGTRLAPGIGEVSQGDMIITPPGGIVSVSRVRSGRVVTLECLWT